MNQEMSLRTPDPLSAFREGLGTRLSQANKREPGNEDSCPPRWLRNDVHVDILCYMNTVRAIDNKPDRQTDRQAGGQ